ncbi:fimbrillin family protein [Bacteroides sp.]|uniref:fimbrillin family protein n=1 Tax=Bacteroides sp. TaxID=29523 RepID=UPI0025877951|nr:fimbrillin family protein [Bacteroides sp.]
MKKNTCFVMLAALMLAGCSNEIDEQVMDSKRVPLQINGDINMLMTRAADDHWDGQDAIGVYMVNAENSIVEGVENKRYKIIDQNNGNFAPDGEDNTAYFPESDNNVNVVAYYPQGDVDNGKLSLNLSDQSEQPRIDLMSARAEGASKNNPAINLNFTHRLTKLFFEIEGDVETKDIYAAIGNQYTDIRYDIINNQLSIAEVDTKKDIVMKYSDLGNGYRFTEAIVLPNEGEDNVAEDRKLTFQLNEKIFNATIGSDTKFETGKKYTYKVKFEQTSSGNVNVSITGVNIKNWDVINDSEGNTIIPGTLKFDRLYLASGFTNWGKPYEMLKGDDGKTFTWTGNIIEGENREMKFTLLQQSNAGDVQLMPNMNGTDNMNVTLDTEMNAYPVIYRDSEGFKRDNKWMMPENIGTYTVTVNVETMKVKVERLDVVYLVGTALTGGEDGYDLKKAHYFTKNSDGKYELTVNLHEGDFKILSQLNYDPNKSDYYAPTDNTPFKEGDLTVDYRSNNNQDFKWMVSQDQIGIYKLILDTSNTGNVKLFVEKK